MGMTFDQYEYLIKDSEAKYIRSESTDGKYREFNLGLFEEAAEVTSPIRKTIKGNYHEQEIDLDHLCEEIGDVLWYISDFCKYLPDCSLQKIALKNLQKTHLLYHKKLNMDQSMTMSQYMQCVIDTYKENLPNSKQERARNIFSLGLIKEIGTLSELVGDHIINENEFNNDRAEEKLGDALWYLAAISESFGLTLEQAALKSIKKVHGRYALDGTVKKVVEEEPEL